MTRKIGLLNGLLAVIATLAAASAAARDPVEPEVMPGRYIVEFTDPPVALFDGRRAADGTWLMAPTRAKSGPLEPEAGNVKEYRAYLERESTKAIADGELRLARELRPRYRYDLLTNGVSLDLSADEAAELAAVDGVKRIYPVTIQRPSTDSGPVWIGAPEAWGASGTMGEGVVVGVIDSGVNWDHPAFADVGGDGYDHDNPRGRQFGLCGNAQVRCNDKLIGVYDFTQEGARLGQDTDGHGTHVASTAVGNVRTSNVVGNTASIQLDVSGVAPHANLITYKVCLADDPATPEDENFCVLDAILAALEQIVVDQVPVVNYSIGGSSSNPWEDSDTRAMLAARAAGTLIVTSAGNSGSEPGTITSPANAPWMLAVANSTHNRRFQNVLDSMTGGNAAPPPDLAGVGFTGPFGPVPIVYAGDFGNALCGSGEAELQSSCDAHTGRTNPFAPGTFNGEIVVCDRGTYGRIEKGFNVRAAGAGGYVLANTAAQGESTVSDDHCLPATHLGRRDGDELRAWLNAGGEGLRARIAGQGVVVDDSLGDRVSASSSRGPDAFVPGVIKPEVAAPGSNILAAGLTGNTSSFKSGTSMASPHVAGSAALLLGVRPELTPSQLHSLLVSSAINNGMIDSNGTSLADAFDVGAGRVNPEAALRAGLTFDITRREFDLADPNLGGDPGSLNLPMLASSRCVGSCSFVRTVQALDGGQWSARVVSDDGVTGQVTPASFSLAAGESQGLNIELDVSEAGSIGESVTGLVVLTSSEADVAAQNIVFQLTAAAGDLPEVFRISTPSNRGSDQVDLAGLIALPQARFDTLALDRANVLNRSLAADNTNSDPYDNVVQGAFFVTRTVNEAGTLLYAQTGAENPATDL
ncbi:MAG: S8 family serine peptidase, partial [Pseudomonadota bacterium]